jgi:NADH-quinone oxidoreductase subunit L
MLENVWLIPFIPFVSFWLILFFGKRLGDKATQSIGIGALSIVFVLSCVTGYQWIQRAEAAEDGEIEPVEITTDGESYECEGIVVVHEEDGGSGEEGADAEGEHADETPAQTEADIEVGTGTELESPAEAESHAESGLPPCDTVNLDDGRAGAPAASGTDQDEGGNSSGDEGDDHGAAGTAAAPYELAAGDGADEMALVAAGEEGKAEGAAGPVITQWTWFTWGGVEIFVGTQLDGLAAMMLFVVATVSLLVHIYSTEYLKGDRRFTHYYAFLSLFTASMLFYVLSSNLLQMLVGWELVGVCSFALIGHWWEEKKNSDAALKAFLTNRVGDVGLLLGVVLLFWAVGGETFSVLGINERAATGQISHTLLLVGALLLFGGVTSKSGQFPLHTWLPDAMAGPTPVSALIHAATMVVAGVYLIARLYPVFYEGLSISTGTINYVAFIGGFTTVMAGVLAFTQRDIKKVLAYSTVSQLGYMVMALGVGAWTAGVFHIFTHAFFKASLFLGAGSVSHACHHSFDMKADMGGLKKYMPQTYWTFAISSAALAGIFPLSGFWSKDEILAGAYNGQEGGAYTFMLVMGCITALLTAAYMTRCIYYTFFGDYRGHGHPHESPAVITVPLWILTGLAVVVGVLNLPTDFAPSDLAHRFETWVEPSVAFSPVVHSGFIFEVAVISTVLAGGGWLLAYLWYWKGLGPHGITERNKAAAWLYRFVENKYYLDDLYEKVIRDGVKGPVAAGANWFNRVVLDGIVNGVGRVQTVIGPWIYRNVDQRVVDATVNGTGLVSEEAGQELRRIQTGRVQWYAALLFGGAVVLAGVFVVVV